MARIKPEVSKARIARAQSACGRKIKYTLGKGGFEPSSQSPASGADGSGLGGWCDCSGFVAWVLSLCRDFKRTNKAERFGMEWFETSNVHRDATGPQRLLKRLSEPEPGCVLVYPDSKVRGRRREGHVAIVTRKEGKRLFGVDCSSGMFARTQDAVHERDITFMLDKGAVPCALAQDFYA